MMLFGGLTARAPLVDSLTGNPASGVRLDSSLWYRIFAPISNLFDALTLLSVPQIVSTFAFVLVVAAIIRIVSSRSRSLSGRPAFSAISHLRFFANVLGALLAISGIALLSARPMASISVEDPDVVAVDFHSHTSASHDGRPMFTPEQNREWHRRAGFDVAYVTDHHTFAGANAAMLANPASGEDGVVLLPGLEYRDEDEHVLALGLDPRRTDPQRREWHPMTESQRGTGTDFGEPALLILCLPGDVDKIPADEEIGIARLAGIEISDGSPRGLQQGAADFPAIRALARKLNLALVSGSDNHGWGNAAAAWTLLRIPGWRRMPPDVLDASIRRTLRTRGNLATRVVGRRLPPNGSPTAIALTAPMIAIGITRDTGWEERFSWMAWTWGIGLAVLLVRRRLAVRFTDAAWQFPEQTQTEY